MKNTQRVGLFGLGVVAGVATGGLATAAIGAELGATWTGVFLVGAATQLVDDQPFSLKQLATQTAIGGAMAVPAPAVKDLLGAIFSKTMTKKSR